MNVEQIMKSLEAEMRKGKPNQRKIDDLNKQLDKALGTELQDEDQDRAEAWERNRRN